MGFDKGVQVTLAQIGPPAELDTGIWPLVINLFSFDLDIRRWRGSLIVNRVIV